MHQNAYKTIKRERKNGLAKGKAGESRAEQADRVRVSPIPHYTLSPLAIPATP
jgi:hypothetical protein